MYEISKALGEDDFENHCLQPSDGGQYSAENAIKILENGYGGSIQHAETGRGFVVSPNKASNAWLRKELKIK